MDIHPAKHMTTICAFAKIRDEGSLYCPMTPDQHKLVESEQVRAKGNYFPYDTQPMAYKVLVTSDDGIDLRQAQHHLRPRRQSVDHFEGEGGLYRPMTPK